MFGFFVLFRRFIFFQDFLRRFRRFCHFTKSFYGSLKQIYQCKKQSNCMLFWALAVYTAQTLSNWYSGSIFGDYCLLLLFLFLSFFCVTVRLLYDYTHFMVMVYQIVAVIVAGGVIQKLCCLPTKLFDAGWFSTLTQTHTLQLFRSNIFAMLIMLLVIMVRFANI